jgi:O-antigen ligase
LRIKKPYGVNLILSLFHVILGALLIKGLPIKLYSASILVLGIYFILKSENKKNEAALWSAYMVGAEVFFRMSKGLFFYEFPKYSVLIFLFTGIVVEQRKHHVSVSYLIYILLLLMGIAFMDIPFTESIRTNIAFNLSGPIVLGVSSIYFYKRSISISTLFKMLFFMALPIISMAGLLFIKTPDLDEIVFGGVSNRTASGGYGPNQVATLLGLGAFIFSVHLFFKKRFFNFFYIDILMFSYLIYRGLVTLSRGGMITAFMAISVFTYYFIISSEDKIKNILKYAGLISLFGIGLWVYTSEATGGMLMNRYTNKNASGIKKEDLSAGRLTIFESELEGLYENPFFGLGVGGGKYYRMETLDLKVASHNEMSRLLGEHGFIGIIILLILIIIPTKHILNQPYLARAFLASFFIFWFLTINHSAMRIAFPGFIYGLSLMTILNDEE